MICLHWEWVELASVAVPLVVVVAAMRLAGLSLVLAVLAGAVTYRAGGRLARRTTSPAELACIVSYGGLRFEVPFNHTTGLLDGMTRQSAHRMCRETARGVRRSGRLIARARHRPIRMDHVIWHPSTAVFEFRPRGRLIRP